MSCKSSSRINHTSALSEYEEIFDRNPRKSSKILVKSSVDKVLGKVSPGNKDSGEQPPTPKKLMEVVRGTRETQQKM